MLGNESDKHTVTSLTAQEMPMLLGPAETIITGDAKKLNVVEIKLG